jgi:hypothetical protein
MEDADWHKHQQRLGAPDKFISPPTKLFCGKNADVGTTKPVNLPSTKEKGFSMKRRVTFIRDFLF